MIDAKKESRFLLFQLVFLLSFGVFTMIGVHYLGLDETIMRASLWSLVILIAVYQSTIMILMRKQKRNQVDYHLESSDPA